MALTKVTGSGVEGITNLSNATFLSVNASEVATLLTSAVINSEGGAVTHNIAQGLAKAWGNFNGVGTVATRDSYNQSSLTDSGTGLYTVNVTAAFGNTSYSPIGKALVYSTWEGGLYDELTIIDADTLTLRHREDNLDSDTTSMYYIIHGDLA